MVFLLYEDKDKDEDEDEAMCLLLKRPEEEKVRMVCSGSFAG